jgi:MFS family permease
VVLYLTCIGMFGIGVGMLYTPILVDRMQLVYPSGFAVANILRALTDKDLLKRSIAKLGGGAAVGFIGGVAALIIPAVEKIGVSTSTIGAGMVVGARIGVPGAVVGLIGFFLTPYLKSIGWLGDQDHYRKIGFIIALGTILGAAIIDISLIGYEAVKRFTAAQPAPARPAEDWKRVNTLRLGLWVIGWGAAVVFVMSRVLHQPLAFILVAIGLMFIFVLVNGISDGISDWNPLSSAFVVTVLILASIGLRDPIAGLMCAGIVLIACNVAVDMQQDRSTGWRLGTNRVNQFRYQVIGVLMGAVLAVVLAKVFMSAYPVLRIDTYSNPNVKGAEHWQSAMTYKFVGALKGITDPKPHIMKALQLGLAIGFVTEIVRKLLKRSTAYKTFIRTKSGGVIDFVLDAVIIPSPYASSFGGFVEFPTTLWFAGGGILGSSLDFAARRPNRLAPVAGQPEVPADMSTTSLIGGGLIAGDSLAALTVGIYRLLQTVL